MVARRRKQTKNSRNATRQWAEETGIADKLLNLIEGIVRDWEGVPTNPRT